MGNAIHYSYDAAGRKITKTQGDITTYYSYDALGRLSAMQRGDRIDITEYDALYRIVEERIEDAAGTGPPYNTIQIRPSWQPHYTMGIHR